jgi:GNAT superfamily N-acetyltransferase
MIEIRSVPIDHAASLALDNEVWVDEAITAADAHGAAGWYREHASWLALERDQPLGTGFAGILSHVDDVLTRIAVPPGHRRRGAGTALWRACSAWARERGHAELNAWIPAGDPDSLAWATRRGYRERGREDLFVLELRNAELPRPEPPQGVELTSLADRPELARGVHDVVREAWPDIPGHAGEEIEPFEDWWRVFGDAVRFPPGGTVVAVAGGEAVGYAQLRLRANGAAWNAMTGIRRAWRGRGVATALKLAQLEWAKQAGIERVTTLNETRNEPIRRLNERLGYEPRPGRIRVVGPLSDAT